MEVSVYLAIVLQWTFTDISKTKKSKQSTNYELLWKKGELLFDDGKEYLGFIIGKDPKSGQWITRFKDDVEDKCVDPSADDDYTLIN